MRKFAVVISIAVFFALIGCSGPSESKLRQDYKAFLDNNWPGSCKLLDFKKLGSNKLEKSSWFPGERVEVRYYAKVEVINDLPNRGFGAASGMHLLGMNGLKWIKPTGINFPDFSRNPFQMWNPDDYKIKKGYVFEISNSRVYMKSDKGWE